MLLLTVSRHGSSGRRARLCILAARRALAMRRSRRSRRVVLRTIPRRGAAQRIRLTFYQLACESPLPRPTTRALPSKQQAVRS